MLTATLPAGPQLPAFVTLSYRVGNARVLVPATFDPASRRLVARLRVLGFPGGAAPAPRLLRAPRVPVPKTTVPPADAEFLLDAAVLAQFLSAGEAALTRMEAEQSVPAADGLNSTMITIALITRPAEVEAVVLPLLDRWRNAICSRVALALNAYTALSTASPFDFPDYFWETTASVAWAGAMKQLERTDIGLPFDGCPTDVPAYHPVLRDKAAQFITRIQ